MPKWMVYQSYNAAIFLKGSMAAAFLVGGALILAGVAFAARPRDPKFEVESIELKGFNLRFCPGSPLFMAVVDTQLILSIKVINPNIAPIEYSSTVMEIYYKGDLIGKATVKEGDQAANSDKILKVPAKLDGLEITGHMKDVIKDVSNREMCLQSVVTIRGSARIWKWKHKFEVHVNSDIKVDPILLDVLEQDNRVHMELANLANEM